jgi:PBP1b-binding outer membrane lipoprotein LpoB
MRIISTLALVALLLAGCGQSLAPQSSSSPKWADKVWDEANTPNQMGGI